MGEIKEDWAKFIISQALLEIKSKEDIPRVVEKVSGTAVGVREDLMATFLSLVKAKAKLLRSST